MKKLISLLLAVSVMAMSSTSFAASLVASGQRNPGGYENTPGNRNSNYLRDGYGDTKILAVYRPGDTLTFSSSDQTKINEGDVITFISSQLDATDLNSSTVMFIDQVTVGSDPLSYKIRDGLAEGIYKMDIKIGSAEVDTFYYAIGDPKVEVLYVDEEETQQAYYDEKDGKTYYFATISIGSGDVMFEQAGVNGIGFKFGDKEYYLADSVTAFDTITYENQIEGQVNWFFSIGVTDVEGDAPVATAIMN